MMSQTEYSTPKMTFEHTGPGKLASTKYRVQAATVYQSSS